MDILKIEKGFAIKIRYELKDLFRQSFPSAKWNKNEKQWEVGKRTEQRLEQWMSKVIESGILEVLEKKEELLLPERELYILKDELKELKSEIKEENENRRTAEAIREKAQNLLKLIEDNKQMLEEANKALMSAEIERDRAQDKLRAIVKEVFKSKRQALYEHSKELKNKLG